PKGSSIAGTIIFLIEFVIALYVFVRDINFFSYLPIDELVFLQCGFYRSLIAVSRLAFAAQGGLKIIIRQSVAFLDLLNVLVDLLVGDLDAALADLCLD